MRAVPSSTRVTLRKRVLLESDATSSFAFDGGDCVAEPADGRDPIGVVRLVSYSVIYTAPL